jgi:micrococcal nuclease
MLYFITHSAILIASLFLSYSSFAQTVTKVIDGDTFKALWNGDTVTVRLCGIDSPESRDNAKARKDAERRGQDVALINAMGKRATQYVRKLLPPGTNVRLEFDVRERDKYGRMLAYVYLPNGALLNEQILIAGYGVPMTIAPNVRYAERFRIAHQRAVNERKGLYSR